MLSYTLNDEPDPDLTLDSNSNNNKKKKNNKPYKNWNKSTHNTGVAEIETCACRWHEKREMLMDYKHKILTVGGYQIISEHVKWILKWWVVISISHTYYHKQGMCHSKNRQHRMSFAYPRTTNHSQGHMCNMQTNHNRNRMCCWGSQRGPAQGVMNMARLKKIISSFKS